MENVIIIVILACIIGGILKYLYRQKKRGAKCVGCPYCKQCSGHCGGHTMPVETVDQKE